MSAFDPTETLLSAPPHRCPGVPVEPKPLTDSDVDILVGLTVADLGHHITRTMLMVANRELPDHFQSQSADLLAAEAKRRGLL